MPDGAGGVWLPRTAVGEGDDPEGGGEVVVAAEVGVAGFCVADPDCAAGGEAEDVGVVPTEGDALCAPGGLCDPVDDAVGELGEVLGVA